MIEAINWTLTICACVMIVAVTGGMIVKLADHFLVTEDEHHDDETAGD